MEREQAVIELKKLEGVDLRPLAKKYSVTVWKDGEPRRKNKGWAGHVLERHLGLPINSAQSPNFGSWELKIVPLKMRRDGTTLVPKETMAITMIDAYNVQHTPFEKSHLLAKLQKAVICARIFKDIDETSSPLFQVTTFDLGDSEIYNQVREDYEFVREVITRKGFEALTGKFGKLVQPRTKGPGHGSVSRAFYARTGFVAKILGLDKVRASDAPVQP
ncbi:MAG TPA: MvaI/BcnI family restriction endonuclease [Opitutales bacterium]|nr:MvaI/BcnI family restriction endonuclease [Opitutales bacterium]